MRRRFSDFEWIREKIEQKLKVFIDKLKLFEKKHFNYFFEQKITPPPLPDKAWKRQIPFMKETLFDDQFVEDRRRALDHFINKFVDLFALCIVVKIGLIF